MEISILYRHIVDGGLLCSFFKSLTTPSTVPLYALVSRGSMIILQPQSCSQRHRYVGWTLRVISRLKGGNNYKDDGSKAQLGDFQVRNYYKGGVGGSCLIRRSLVTPLASVFPLLARYFGTFMLYIHVRSTHIGRDWVRGKWRWNGGS
jgi:hypothetical protein